MMMIATNLAILAASALSSLEFTIQLSLFPWNPDQIVRSIIGSTGNRQTIGIFGDDWLMWAVANNRLQWIIWINTLWNNFPGEKVMNMEIILLFIITVKDKWKSFEYPSRSLSQLLRSSLTSLLSCYKPDRSALWFQALKFSQHHLLCKRCQLDFNQSQPDHIHHH